MDLAEFGGVVRAVRPLGYGPDNFCFSPSVHNTLSIKIIVTQHKQRVYRDTSGWLFNASHLITTVHVINLSYILEMYRLEVLPIPT